MSLPLLVLFGTLGVWALTRGTSGSRVTSGTAELVPGGRYRFTYVSSRPLTLDEASELVASYSVTALSVSAGAPGYWLLSFEAEATARVPAKIGTPLRPDEALVTLAEVARLG